MIDRPTLKKPAADDELAAPRQTRRTEERFVLKIDGQAKRSFTDKESAMKAGREIKKNYPVVNASVYDSREGTNELC